MALQARNREAGRVGQVYLRYDRASGRYFDVDNPVDGADACPIRPLTLPAERLEAGALEGSSELDAGGGAADAADAAEPERARAQRDGTDEMSIREMMDVGGMVV